jgi:hypothetical protein
MTSICNAMSSGSKANLESSFFRLLPRPTSRLDDSTFLFPPELRTWVLQRSALKSTSQRIHLIPANRRLSGKIEFHFALPSAFSGALWRIATSLHYCTSQLPHSQLRFTLLQISSNSFSSRSDAETSVEILLRFTETSQHLTETVFASINGLQRFRLKKC